MTATNTTTVTEVDVTDRWSARRIAAAIAVGAGFVLAGCAQNAPQDATDPAGENARKIYNLSWPIFTIAGVVGVIVIAVITYIVIKFRDQGQPMPEQTHGKPKLEIALTILPALILVGVAVPTISTLIDLAETDDTECIVNITGQQWWWEVAYPVQDGCGGISQPIVTSGQMVIPAGANVLIRGESRDVIHSFWVPRLNGKRDMVPGRTHTLRMQADEPGIYAGQCAEFCGLSHANMRMEVVALTPDGFETWKANQIAPYESPTDDVALAGESAFITNCSRCHEVDGLTDSNGDLVITRADLNVYAGAAPNLTNLMSRNTFAGATFDLLTPECRADVWEASPEEFTDKYLAGVTPECLNEKDLREWLRNAPAKKPMYTDPTQLADTGGLTRGMPYLALSEDQIDDIVAYLLERN